jgi:hypothetical protein
MYLLSITINVDDQVRDELLEWINLRLKKMTSDKSLVHAFRMFRLISEEPGNGSTYSFQYQIPSIVEIDVFEEEYDRAIAVDMYRFYKDKFVEFRSRLELLDTGA